MQVRIAGTANLSQAKAEFAALRAQAEGLNAAMAKTSAIPVNPAGYKRLTGAINAGSEAYRNSLASTGAFRVEQMRLNSATSKYTELLQKQRLSFRDMRKNHRIMQAVYHDQLAMQDMQVKRAHAGARANRDLWDVSIPNQFSKELDTLNNRLAMTSARLKSGGTQMINMGKNTQWAGRQLSVGFTMPMVAVGAAAGYMAFRVDKEMTRVKKVYDTTADQASTSLKDIQAVTKEFAALEADSWNTAKNAADRYGSSITDTLGVQAELAATGERGARLQAATTEVMKSARLGEIDYQTATSATIALQQQLHLSSKELAEQWSYMNSVENATSLQMKDFAAAIPIALGPMKEMGGSLQDLGTLMTAMISRGVQVGKAANAIKALPQRLVRPSKQIQEEWKQITGTDIVKIADKNKGVVMGMLKDIYAATKNLTDQQRTKAFAGLFGSYQLTTMNAMVKGVGEISDGMSSVQSQTVKAAEIGSSAASDWLRVSEQELEQYRNSASGKFEIMVSRLKVAGAELGKPFLEAAVVIGGAVVNVIEAFNGLPKIVKMLVALPLVLMALAGPLLMLVGLSRNLAGQGAFLLGKILGLAKGMTILTMEEQAAAKALQQDELAMRSATAQVASRELQLNLLAQATTKAEQATMAFALAQQGVPTEKINAALAGQTTQTEALVVAEKSLSQQYLINAENAERAAAAQRALHAAALGAGKAAPAQWLESAAMNEGSAIGWRAKAAEEAAKEAAAKSQTAKSTGVISANTAKTQKYLAGGAASAAVMAASMATMMLTSNETAQHAAALAMTGAILVPALQMAVGPMKNVAASMKDAYKSSLALTVGMAKATGGARAFGAAMLASMGPVGWTIAAVAAIGFSAYKIWKWNKETRLEQEKQNKAITSQNNLLQNSLDISPRGNKSLTPVTFDKKPGEYSSDQLAEQMGNSDTYKPIIQAMKDAKTETDQATIAMEKYSQVLNATGGDASKAQKYVEALYMASGKSALTASIEAQKIFDNLGNITDTSEKFELWGRLVAEVLTKTDKMASDRGVQIGKALADAIARGADSNDVAKSMTSQFVNRWNIAFDNLGQLTKKYYERVGIQSGEQLRSLMAGVSKFDELDTSGARSVDFLQDRLNISEQEAYNLRESLNYIKESNVEVKNLGTTEQEASQELAKQLNLSKGQVKNIKTMADLTKYYAYQLLSANKSNAYRLYQGALERRGLKMGIDIQDEAQRKKTNAEKLELAQAAARRAGLKVVNDLSEQEVILQRAAAEAAKDSAHGIGDAATQAGKLKGALKGVPKYVDISVRFNKKDLVNIRKSAMTGVMDDYATMASSTFDERMNASLDASQKGWDNKIAAADAAAEKASNRLDAKWERIHNASDRKWERRKDQLTAYYDKRIDAVDAAIKAEEKAEEIRQKIFEAEKTRIERLTEMANKNIDFNVAINTGNLDEAAKIRNDMNATTADWALSDAGTAGEGASKARVDRLETRKDVLQKQQDAAEKALEKRERAEKASLDRREKAQKAHMQRVQKANADGLKKQADADMASQKKRWDYEKFAFDRRIELFKSYIARDQKDLDRWMKVVGLSYDDFGGKVKGKGENWSKAFQESLTFHTRKAGQEIANDKMWATMARNGRIEILHSMGFKDMGEFRRFIAKGILPPEFGSRKFSAVKPAGAPVRPTGLGIAQAVHSGGVIGETDNRVGVARTQRGLHPSETLINAQYGEYLVDRKHSAQYRPLLEAISGGRLDSARNVGFGVGGEAPGIAPFVVSALMKGFSVGLGQSMKSAFEQKKSVVSASTAGGYGATKGGQYGDRDFSAGQLKNAAIIASVGSEMGMSKRDIKIGIMTAITESGLVNVKYGDRDSLGLFQQRPSQGWGTPEQVTDPVYASRKFFSVLRGHSERNDEAPWLAAQHVQRSAYSDGSNYRQYWDEAQAIFLRGLVKTTEGISATGGSGGRHRASVPGKGWVNSHDYRNGLGSPLYAIDDGRIIESRAITAGGSPGNGLYGGKYRSFGETILLRTNGGTTVRYAHLNPGARAHTGPVKGGALIGRSGMTGNATGPHTHFEVNGSTLAREWFASHGIGLNTGGYTTSDGMANLHKDEVVISPERTDDLYRGLDKFSSFMDSVRNVGNGTGGEPLGVTDPWAGVGRLFGVGQQAADPGAVNSGWWNAPDFSSSTSAPTGTASKKGYARIATFNAHTYGHSPARTQADMRKVMPHADAIALQEWTNAAGSATDWLKKQGWGFFRGPTGTAIAWRKSKFTASNLGSWDLNKKYKMPKGTSQRYAVYGMMKDRETGSRFWMGSAHLIPPTGYFKGRVSDARRRAILAEQYQRLAMLKDKLDNRAPVVFGGDFNDRRTKMLKGLRSSSPGKTIDQIYSSLSATGKASKIDTKGLASDHSAYHANYKLPKLKTGAYTMSDGLAHLHKNELVTSAEKTRQLYEGIENFASGGKSEYHVHMSVNGATYSIDEVIAKTVKGLKRMESRKPQGRRG